MKQRRTADSCKLGPSAEHSVQPRTQQAQCVQPPASSWLAWCVSPLDLNVCFNHRFGKGSGCSPSPTFQEMPGACFSWISVAWATSPWFSRGCVEGPLLPCPERGIAPLMGRSVLWGRPHGIGASGTPGHPSPGSQRPFSFYRSPFQKIDANSVQVGAVNPNTLICKKITGLFCDVILPASLCHKLSFMIRNLCHWKANPRRCPPQPQLGSSSSSFGEPPPQGPS